MDAGFRDGGGDGVPKRSKGIAGPWNGANSIALVGKPVVNLIDVISGTP